MDFYRLFATCIFGAVSLFGVEAMDACVQDTAVAYSECMQSMIPLIQVLGSNASAPPDPNDPMAGTTAMMEVFCSPEGRGAMNCMLGVMKRCPALMGGAQGSTGLMPGLDFNALMSGGGMEAYCEMLIGPCKAILPCITKAMQEEQSPPDMMGTEAGVTDGRRELGYGALYQLCGPKREVTMCFSDHFKECPHTSAKFRELMKEQFKNMPIAYERVEHFLLNDCKDMPTGNDQSCETAALASDGFRGCFDGMIVKYNISGSTTSCDAYDDAAECLDTHVEPTCGKESTDFLKKGSALFIPGIPTEKTCYGATGSAVILQSSATLVMIASMFVLGRV